MEIPSIERTTSIYGFLLARIMLYFLKILKVPYVAIANPLFAIANAARWAVFEFQVGGMMWDVYLDGIH